MDGRFAREMTTLMCVAFLVFGLSQNPSPGSIRHPSIKPRRIRRAEQFRLRSSDPHGNDLSS